MVKTLKKSSLKKKPSKEQKPHPKNPNYFGKNYKSPEKKIYVNKVKEIMEEPLKQIKDDNKKVVSIIKLQKSLHKIPSPMKVESTKFKKFINSLDNIYYRKLVFVLPIILYRLSSLLIHNQGMFLKLMDVYTKNMYTTQTQTWQQMSFISKYYKVIVDYMKIIFEKSSILGTAELIVFASLIVDEIPKILFSTDYKDAEQLAVLKIAKHLAQNVKKVDEIVDNKVNQQQKEDALKNTERALVSLVEKNAELTRRVDILIGGNAESKGETQSENYMNNVINPNNGEGLGSKGTKPTVAQINEFNRKFPPISADNKGSQMWSRMASQKKKTSNKSQKKSVFSKPKFRMSI
jgi:hypothetical protein